MLKSSAIKTNLLLIERGLQYQEPNKDCRLTDTGKEYGEEFPYVRNNHSGYQIKWNESVVSVLI